MTTTLLLVRGLPGSGKTTFAKTVAQTVLAADDFFMKDGRYEWNPDLLGQAHESCLRRTLVALQSSPGTVVAVTNVFARRSDLEHYFGLLAEFAPRSIRVWVVDLFDQGMTDYQLAQANTHGVPIEKIASFRSRWEH